MRQRRTEPLISTSLTPVARSTRWAGGAPMTLTSTRWIGCSWVMTWHARNRELKLNRRNYPFWAWCAAGVARGGMNDRMARPARRIGNVPSEATTLIGRRHELTELRAKFATARVVSLVGPGGVGKTRLAIRAATDLARGFRDGAWFVDLAEVRDP